MIEEGRVYVSGRMLQKGFLGFLFCLVVWVFFFCFVFFFLFVCFVFIFVFVF